MSDNAFARILASLESADGGVTEKTASETENARPDPAQRMLQTVRSVSASLQPTTKTATTKAESSVAGDLKRMAKQAQASEAEAMTKQAHFLGAAVCDGFMERFAQYDGALNQLGVKTASENVPQETLKKVAEAAYNKAVEDMEKHAQDEYTRGYNDTLEHIHKTASDIHYIGQQAAHELIKQASQQS
jgi:hypothetical protein